MPSGAKKRKAAKKKKLQENTHSHGEDVKSDGGEVSSPVSQDEAGNSFGKGEEVELGKREDGLSAQVVVPESGSLGEADMREVGTKEEGGVEIEWELKLEDDSKSKNISIESAEEVHGGGSSSSGSSSRSSSDDESEDESEDVDKNIAVVETGLVVDTVEPVETGQVVGAVEPVQTGQVVESVELGETLAEVASQVIEKVEESDNKVTETGPSIKLDESLSSMVNQVSDSILARETENMVAEAVQVVDLAGPTDCSSEVVNKVHDTVQNGETRNGDVENFPVVESEKDSLVEETVEVIESAITENHNTSSAVELDLPEVGEKEILTLDTNNADSLQLVDSGSENKELKTSEKAVTFSDAKDSASEVQEDKLELSYNSFVGNTGNGAVPVPDYQNPEYPRNQLPVASTSQAVQKASVKSCCGLFELFTSSDR
ncbi:hypothetical protein POM88_025248 [Heracleum sosnowskyi]|uniref:Uncharacterized protein n=1 Tax=Heracleum sosnowskyi TaxID=360622 RepID=A0AAD8I3M6_9APIA|nr:hypothetical protein POM88_025248 [Heracleum sosnowskyi]